MPRFIVLTHDHPVLHWDFMLEAGESLATWRLASPPESGADIVAEALPGHRLAYLDYEGPVSGGRGSVTRYEAGSFAWLERSETRIRVRLHGERLVGEASLVRGEDQSTWTFRFLEAPEPSATRGI